jgi:Domain of unknown function (DUF4249)
MKYFRQFSFLLFLVIGACIDPITLKINSDEGVIVVDGGITNQPGPYTVYLFRSVKVENDLEKRQGVTGAFAYIIDDEGNTEKLKDNVPGVFVSSASFQAKLGHSYYLRIEAFGGLVYESLPQVLHPIDPIDSLYFEFVDKPDSPGSKENNAGFNVFLNSRIAGTAEYVRWAWSGTYEVRTFPEKHTGRDPVGGFVIPDPRPCSGYYSDGGILRFQGPCGCCNCWVTEPSRFPEVGDAALVGRQFSHQFIGYVPATKSLFYSKYRVEVEQSSISEEVYNYWDLVRVQKQAGSSLFQPASAKIKGNVKCISDPTQEIFGLFTVSSKTKKSIFINKSDIPFALLPLDSLADDCTTLFKNSTTVKPEGW